MHIQIITRMILSKSKPAEINQTISFLKMRVLSSPALNILNLITLLSEKTDKMSNMSDREATLSAKLKFCMHGTQLRCFTRCVDFNLLQTQDL